MIRDHRILGCLLAGAVGDALGAAVEFDPLGLILSRFGPEGLTDFASAYGRIGAITDDTQMTLFTLEGLLDAHQAGADDPIPAVAAAYQRWMVTQTLGAPRADDKGLLAARLLYSRRAPGSTCMGALDAIASGELPGSTDDRINDSKGCGGIMRAAPAAFLAADQAQAFRLGADVAAITHGHPSGYLSAGALAAIVWALLHGSSLDVALDTTERLLIDWPGHVETLGALRSARLLAEQGNPTPARLARLGEGWTGEESLAIAVYAALVSDSLEAALLLAVNHSGDSDSTGAICGNILGALHGASAVPARWSTRLEGVSLVRKLAKAAAAAASPQ